MMPEFAVIEAKPWHVGQMVRILRREQRAENGLIDFNAHRELRNRFMESSWRRAWLMDGKLAALGGVNGPAVANTGMVWLAISEDAVKHPVAVTRMVLRQLKEIMQVKRELTTVVLDTDEASKRFARWIGFRPSADAAYPGVTAMIYEG